MRFTFALCLIVFLFAGPSPTTAQIFSPAAPTGQWSEFESEGFDHPVSGVVFGNTDKVCAGMGLGGLGTGCLDIETSGVLGFSSIFRPASMVDPTPYLTLRNAQLYTPFLGLAVGKDVWVLATDEMLKGGTFRGCVDPVDPGNYTENETYMAHWQVKVPQTENVKPAETIRYWGHYPVVDIDYQTDAPVTVSLRAWAPFIPGDATDSAIPGAVFEVHLENTSNQPQQGTVAFNFPGPGPNETSHGDKDTQVVGRHKFDEPDFEMTEVSVNETHYGVGVLQETGVRFGGNLSTGGSSWSEIATTLPKPDAHDLGTSAAVDFKLAAGEKKTVRFVLAWMIDQWKGGKYNEIKHFDETWTENEWTLSHSGREDQVTYQPIYTTRYNNTRKIIQDLATHRASLLERILAWQQQVYITKELPVWLRDALVNNLALFGEDSLWAAPTGPITEWAWPLGAFQMTECPRTCAIVGCIASNYYGDLPITYFFPELERQILRGYKAYIRPDGAVPFLYPPKDFTKPSYEWQVGLNGACFADLVHRLWLRTGDNTIVQEFYQAVKKNTEFTVGLADGEHGIISFHREGHGQEWWEHTPVFGMVTHLAGVRLAQLRFAHRMATYMGDDPFASQCETWIKQASQLTEKYLWNDDTQSYLFFLYPEKEMESADIMSSQLDGQWMVDLHGLPPVFRRDRIDAALKTIQKTCFVDRGLAGFAEPGKGPDLARYGTFPPEVNIVAMTYMYHGQKALGLEIARRNMANIILDQGLGWDMPNLIRCDTGARTYGADYYQNMVLWGLPAAVAGQDLSGPCQGGGLIERMLTAGAKPVGQWPTAKPASNKTAAKKPVTAN